MTDELKILLIAAIIVAFLVGLIIGRLSVSKKQTKNNQKELDQYKQAVNAHFAQTADLVDNLTDSYKAVFDHLGDSAKNLLSKEEMNKLLESRQHKTTTLNYLSKEEASLMTEEPSSKKEESTDDDINNTTKEDSKKNKAETSDNESIDIDNPESHKKSGS